MSDNEPENGEEAIDESGRNLTQQRIDKEHDEAEGKAQSAVAHAKGAASDTAGAVSDKLEDS